MRILCSKSPTVLPSSLVLAGVITAIGCRDEAKPARDAPDQQEAPAPAEVLDNEKAPTPSAPLIAGQTVYDFNALAHNGQRVQLSEFLDKPVVVYFCPNDRAQLCTDLAVTIRDAWLDLNSHVSMVFGISTEGTVMHRDFSSEHQLPHLLLADAKLSVHQVFGLEGGMATSYLIGKDLTILRVLPANGGAVHVAALKQALAELNLLNEPYPI